MIPARNEPDEFVGSVAKQLMVARVHDASIIDGIVIDMNETQVRMVERQVLHLADALTKLDKCQLLILDDVGYVRHTEAETSVLFELIAHRYEDGSLLITSNQPFSAWDRTFPDNVAVAAIDPFIHHAHVVELTGENYRKYVHAKQRKEVIPAPTA